MTKLCPKCKHQQMYEWVDSDYCNGCKLLFNKDGSVKECRTCGSKEHTTDGHVNPVLTCDCDGCGCWYPRSCFKKRCKCCTEGWSLGLIHREPKVRRVKR